MSMRSGVRSMLVQSPTGSGKTILTAYMLKTAESKGMAAFFIVHRRELIEQSIETFNTVNVPHGVIARGFPQNRNKLIQIASIQTLVRRYEQFKKPSLIIWDECHHISAGSWDRLYRSFPDAYHIGLTATPQRLDGTGLNKWFEKMIKGPSVRWLIDNGFLCNYTLYAPSGVNLDGVHTRMGDYVQSEIEDIVDRPTVTGDAIKHYLKFCNGKRAVAFCVSVKHSKHVVEQFNKSGIIAAHVDAKTPPEERSTIIRRFRDGKIKVLSNVELFGEGFDLPALEAAILLRPTKSIGLYLQQVGRALRPSLDKDKAVILDHAGNCHIHGFPDDEREWSLKGRKGKKSKPGVLIKTCKACFAAIPSKSEKCPHCGYEFIPVGREVEFVDGDLVEVDTKVTKDAKLVEQGKCRTFEDLVALGKRRNYRYPYKWAKIIMQTRKKKELDVESKV